MRVLFLTSPVGPLGSGEGGGVEANLMNLTPILAKRGHAVTVIAPWGSVQPSPDVAVLQVQGVPPDYATTARRDAQTTARSDGVLERMWELALRVQDQFDAIVGINYDWLAYYLTPFFRAPVGHVVSICSQIDDVDTMMRERFYEHPERFAVNTCAQAQTFDFMDPCRMTSLYGGIDPSRYAYNPSPARNLSWVARISPEKGLQDAFEVARKTGLSLDVCGKMQHQRYWDDTVRRYPDVRVTNHGFLPQVELHQIVRETAAMLMTPHTVEAFGNTCIEAMAAGTPVVAYDAGGPSEIIEHGLSGFLTPNLDIGAMAEAVSRVGQLDRACARARAEQFTLEKMADRYLAWIERFVRASA